ncbi:MAG: GlsB/YeaQ/YmgE family stress response membrane protein [Methylococcus sp.]|nr:GlsB/YeaQ/YmgE family stress response membrane protein [Methylococcus sp.]
MEGIWFVLVGLAAGWLAGRLITGGGSSIIGYIIVGVFGSVLGGVLFDVMGVPAGSGILGKLFVATVGAITFLFLLHVLKKR